MLLTSLAALAAEPTIHTYTPIGLGEPIWAPCPIAPKEPVVEEEAKAAAPSWDVPGWPVVDLASGQGDPAILGRARAAVEVDKLNAEPLRGAAADLANVRAVWKRAATGLVRVAAAGDSHMTGDGIPGQLRRVLQVRYGDGGPGFVMPAVAGGTHQVGRVYTCRAPGWSPRVLSQRALPLLGPAGASVSANRETNGAWVEVWQEPRPTETLSTSILYFTQPNGGTFELGVDHASPVVVETRGARGPALARMEIPSGSHHFGFATRGDGPVTLAGMVVERAKPATGVVIDGLGAKGRTLATWSLWDGASMAAWTALRPYDLVILSGGSADLVSPTVTEESFRATARAALQDLRKVLPDAACVVIGPADRAHRLDKERLTVHASHTWANRVLRELAPEARCVTWDLQALMGGEGSAVAWYDAGLMGPDLLHLTPAGYQAVANQLLSQLDPR